uniref:Pygopus homolog 2-like n=1 Tax=Phallusia mammillata TaxID=59560 RepID=A0A6F9DQT2_9ASCI|nr:pygopus homolog 2-like [Phallusia mammillata]
MPKKKESQESKKARKTSATSKDTSTTSPGAGDIVPPPNPSATHLVASNPFDDPPQNSMKMGPGFFPNQPMVRLQAPGGGMGSPYPGFPGRPELHGMRYPGPGGPVGPGWNVPMHSNNGMSTHPGYHHNMTPNPNMPNNGYMNRPPYGPGMPPFRASPRMHMNSVRPGMGPLGSPGPDSVMMDNQSMGPGMMSGGNHGHMLQNTGQMKALTRPPAQLPSPSTSGRKTSTSSSKTEGKSPKSSEPSSKSRKKSEKKPSAESKKAEAEKAASQESMDHNVVPHSIPPVLPQKCKSCSNDIASTDDVIRCLASCRQWYHRTCVGLTEAAYSHLKSEELAIWACDVCLQNKEIFSVQPRHQLFDHLTSAA